MAIQKDYETNFGFTCNYWSISYISIDKINKVSSVKIVLYKDETAKKVDKKSAILGIEIDYVWHGDNFPFTVEALSQNDPYKIAYSKILAEDPFFQDAVEV